MTGDYSQNTRLTSSGSLNSNSLGRDTKEFANSRITTAVRQALIDREIDQSIVCSNDSRRARYRLQKIAASILYTEAKKIVAKNRVKRKHALKTTGWRGNEKEIERLSKSPPQIFRTIQCGWHPSKAGVNLNASPKTSYYTGVRHCGSVWSCPVCSDRIQYKRGIEVSEAIECHEGDTILLTLTFPHSSEQSLTELLEMQAAALARFRKNGSTRRALLATGYLGLIRGLEATVSRRNGWHLHTHEILFVDKLDEEQRNTLEKAIRKSWEQACRAVGLINDSSNIEAFRAHSVDMKHNDFSSLYITKGWTVSAELTQSNKKCSKQSERFHPFGLLEEIDKDGKLSAFAERKFIEWAIAMKGKRQIHWAKGLKAKLGMKCAGDSDEDLAAEPSDESDSEQYVSTLATIPKDLWLFGIKHYQNFRSDLLDITDSLNRERGHVFADVDRQLIDIEKELSAFSKDFQTQNGYEFKQTLIRRHNLIEQRKALELEVYEELYLVLHEIHLDYQRHESLKKDHADRLILFDEQISIAQKRLDESATARTIKHNRKLLNKLKLQRHEAIKVMAVEKCILDIEL